MLRFGNALVVLFAAAVFVCSSAIAQSKDPGEIAQDTPPRGGTIPIPDNAYDGTLASMACGSYVETQSFTVDDVEVTAAVEHTWIGDLVFKVVSPAGTVATVLSRPGFAEPADDGTECCGDSSDLSLGAPLTFSTSNGQFDAETMGATIATDGVVCQDDSECDFIPNPGAATDSGDLSAVFDGEDAAGTWEFCVGDSALGDTGNLGTVTFNITGSAGPGPIPEIVPVPSMSVSGLLVLVLLLALVSGWFLHRRRSA